MGSFGVFFRVICFFSLSQENDSYIPNADRRTDKWAGIAHESDSFNE